jgi:predicted nucleic acid-binding protein
VTVTAVYTNILLDIWLADPQFLSASKLALERALEEGRVIASSVVVAELAAAFEEPRATRDALGDMRIDLAVPSWDELAIAGSLWRGRRGKRGERMLADYLIAANAAFVADRLLTRDREFAALGVPGLKVSTPADLIQAG